MKLIRGKESKPDVRTNEGVDDIHPFFFLFFNKTREEDEEVLE